MVMQCLYRTLNPTYEEAEDFLLRSGERSYNSLLQEILPTEMIMEKRDLPNPIANRAHAADQWRQLVKRCQTARFVMNINLRKRTTPEDKWMAQLLYDEVPDWRKQKE
ncbi:hypothetical protein DY000_02004460 [Brassica cretica]|uniref:Uncharacterized protein n=1 Tax=Brassica cretica TaxID=69181 RepID=A0ABQ7BXL0_BRACR|nr:hypothetical protein DY000_02004460 [Brassica cretica]